MQGADRRVIPSLAICAFSGGYLTQTQLRSPISKIET